MIRAPRLPWTVGSDGPGFGRRPGGASGPVVIDVYTRPGCHLCEEARAVIDAVASREGACVVEHDITADPALERRYAERIPVVVVAGRHHADWRVTDSGVTAAVRRASRA